MHISLVSVTEQHEVRPIDMGQKIIKLSKETKTSGEILVVQLEKDMELLEILKRNFAGIKWNPKSLRWEHPYDPKLKTLFFATFKGKAWLDYGQLLEEIDGKEVPKILSQNWNRYLH